MVWAAEVPVRLRCGYDVRKVLLLSLSRRSHPIGRLKPKDFPSPEAEIETYGVFPVLTTEDQYQIGEMLAHLVGKMTN